MMTSLKSFMNAWKIMRVQRDPEYFDETDGLDFAKAVADGLLDKDWDCDGPYITVTDLYCEGLESFKEEIEAEYARMEAERGPELEFQYGLTIRPDTIGHDGKTVIDWCLWGHGEYDRSSVMAGSMRNVRLETAKSKEYLLEYAKYNYPDHHVEEQEYPFTPAGYDPGPTAPSWFNPADAGERWNSDY